MGVIRSYQAGAQELFEIDIWLKLPNGTARRHRQKRIPTREHAEALLKQLELDAFEGRYFPKLLEGRVTVEECWVAWEPITRRDNDSWQSDVDRARHLCEYMGQRFVARLTLEDVEQYRNRRFSETTRRGGPPVPATVDREIALLKKCVNHAVACGKLSRNPLAGVSLLNRPNARRTVVKEQTLERILERTPEPLRPAFVLAYETGMRKSEVRLLRWDRVDFEAGCIRLHAEDTKTDEARVIYLTERALAAIKSVPRQLHGVYVFVNPDTGKPWDDLNRHFRKACRRAGQERIVFHDLRRSFVTNARRRGVPESVVMKLSGHRTRNVFDRYNIVDDNDLRSAIVRIEQGRLEEESRRGLVDLRK